ncbi:MAG TPA: hypothetical protein PLB54_04410 [Nitrosomonas sp.]|nr:hypothetical protein [Nitrosomonas sp.]
MNHGGKREGAGRKIGSLSKTKKKKMTFALAQDVIEYLDTVDKPKAQIVDEGLRMHRDLKKETKMCTLTSNQPL